MARLSPILDGSNSFVGCRVMAEHVRTKILVLQHFNG